MINLTIDGRNIEVPEGTTILQAAAEIKYRYSNIMLSKRNK